MTTLKVTQVGDALAVILPDDVAARLKVGEGDVLYATETGSGLALSTSNPDLDRQLALGREFMREYRDTFRDLAK